MRGSWEKRKKKLALVVESSSKIDFSPVPPPGFAPEFGKSVTPKSHLKLEAVSCV